METETKTDQELMTIENLVEEVKKGHVSPKVAAEMTNAVGKIINLTKAEMEYNHMKQKQGVNMNIPFMEKDT